MSRLVTRLLDRLTRSLGDDPAETGLADPTPEQETDRG